MVAGAGLGGLRAAESLRAAGYSGEITVVGEEPHHPYNRPPLSKQALSGPIDPAGLEFRRKAAVDDVQWRLGSPVAGADLAGRTVTLADGTVLPFDGLVVATGLRPRRLPIPGPVGGRSPLRTVEDAEHIRQRLAPGSHLVVLGAGFIGCEVAATARALGADALLVAVDEEPLIRPLGREVGAAMRRRHEEHGVEFALGRTVTAFEGVDLAKAAVLDDGRIVPADVIVEAVGTQPNVEWLAGNGLDLTDGVLVDSGMQVQGTDAPVVAVGDIARYPLALAGPGPLRIEHWNMPTETGRRAGRTLAALLAGEAPDRGPFTAMPSFWSDQYDISLQSFGLPGLATSIEVVEGDVDSECIVEYHDEDGLVGVLGINRTPDLGPYRRQLAERAAQAEGT